MAVDFTIKQGDTLPDLTATILDINKAPIDLTGATVKFRMRKPGTKDVPTVYADAIVIDAPNGKVSYRWQLGDTSIVGTYSAEWVLTTPLGVQTVPSSGYITLQVVSSLV